MLRLAFDPFFKGNLMSTRGKRELATI